MSVTLLVIAGALGCAPESRAQEVQSASTALSDLLRADFNGEMHRGGRVASPPIGDSTVPWHGHALYQCTGDAAVVASAYWMGRVEVSGESARIVVTFCELGRIGKLMASPVREAPAFETVQFVLKRGGGGWSVVSPLVPRVGVAGLRTCLGAEFGNLPPDWGRTASRQDEASHQRADAVLAAFPEKLAEATCSSGLPLKSPSQGLPIPK